MPPRKKAPTSESRTFVFPWQLIKKILPILLIAALFAGFVFVVRKYPHLIGVAPEVVLTPSPLATPDYTSLIAEVSEIFELPNEEATIATVTDPALLSDQDFFAKSQAGDVALIYQNARKAILYRPSQKKVIEVGMLSEDSQNPTPAPTPSEEESIVPLVPTSSPSPAQQ